MPSPREANVRPYASSGLVAGAAAGALVCVLDAVLAGAAHVSVVACYLGALGFVVGGLCGGLAGALWGARTAGGDPPERHASRAALLWIGLAIFIVAMSRAGALFATAFRNRELAALAYAVLALGAAGGAVFAGAALVGAFERFAARWPAGRRAAGMKLLPKVCALACGLVLAVEVWSRREAIDAQAARSALLLAGWIAAIAAITPWLARRGFRLAVLPWIARRTALVVMVVAGYATFQLATGGAPRAVAEARALITLAAAVIPEPDVSSATPDAPPREKKSTARGGDGVSAKAPRVSSSATLTPRREPGGAGPPSILLVTLSSVRADHLSLFGYARPTTPMLDAYAKPCAVFERAYAASSAERDALPALLAGKLPSQLRRSGGAWPRLARGNRLLAEVLAGAGYEAWAVVSHDALARTSGLAPGFAPYDTSPARSGERAALTTVSSPDVSAKARAWLGAAAPSAKPFFLWAHFSDPHARHVPHVGFNFGRRAIDRYDGEIAFTDSHVGALLAAAQGAARSLFVVIVGDHGESLGEGARRGHGRSLADGEVRVPLVVCGPGVRAARVEAPVSVLDLYPTLLELAGLEARKGLPGRSLAAALLRGEALDRERLLPMEIAPVAGRLGAAALVSRSDKLVLVGAGNHPRLYDLRADPQERRNIASRRQDRVRKLQIALHRMRFGDSTVAPPSPAKRRGNKRVLQASDDAAEQEALKRARERKEKLWGLP